MVNLSSISKYHNINPIDILYDSGIKPRKIIDYPGIFYAAGSVQALGRAKAGYALDCFRKSRPRKQKRLDGIERQKPEA